MTPFERFERKFGGYAIPRLHQIILSGQIFTYIGMEIAPGSFDHWYLVPRLALDGEHWRWITFLILPPLTHVVFFILHVMAFNFICGTLEQTWGVLRFNIYILAGWLATVAAAVFYPEMPASNWFLDASTFLAFATLYPDVRFMLYFVIPVQARWLALLTWIGLSWTFVEGGPSQKASVLATIANYLLFFGSTALRRFNQRAKHMQAQAAARAEAWRPLHECVVCGVTDKSDPTMEFRYCSKCQGSACYCEVHIQNHEHLTQPENLGA